MKKEEIEYIQNRLGLLNGGKKITWSLRDRQIVSALCIEATQHSVQSDEVPAWLCDCGVKHLKVYYGFTCACGAVLRR